MVRDYGELDAESWQLFAGLHRMLLRLAGRVPDELLTYLRTLLAGGDLVYLPDATTGSVAQLGVTLAPDDILLLRQVLRVLSAPGGEPAGMAQVSFSDVTPATDHRFAPASPEVLRSAGARMPDRLDLTAGPPAALADLAEDLTDLTDDIGMDALSEEDGVVKVWRAWRSGPDGATENARRIYLAEVELEAAAWDIAYEAAGELTKMHEVDPQVEVFWTGDVLPPYHRNALAHAALLWAGPDH